MPRQVDSPSVLSQPCAMLPACTTVHHRQVFDLLNQRKRLNILEDGKKQVRR